MTTKVTVERSEASGVIRELCCVRVFINSLVRDFIFNFFYLAGTGKGIGIGETKIPDRSGPTEFWVK